MNSTLRTRLAKELREYAIAALYLYVCLGALLLFKAALLGEEGASAVHFGTALGKALVLGKFLVIGEAALLGARIAGRPLALVILRKAALFLLLFVALSLVEEVVVGWLHGHPAAATLGEMEARSPLELLSTCLLMFLVLVPFFAAQETGRALGPGGLRRILWSPPE